MSILTHLYHNPELLPPKLDFLYTHRQSYAPLKPGNAATDTNSYREPVLFFRRLTSLFASGPFSTRSHDQNSYRLALFLTPSIDQEAREGRPNALESEGEITKQYRDKQALVRNTAVDTKHRRIVDDDLIATVNDMKEDQRKGMVAYVCGPPSSKLCLRSELRPSKSSDLML